MSHRFTIPLMLLIALCCTATGCFGYRFGNKALYREDVHTVYVPIIQSDSLRRGLGERLTEAVVKEIETTTPFKVVGNAEADSTLNCRLTSDTKRLAVGTRTDEPRVDDIVLNLSVEWVDRRGQSLIQITQIPLPAAFTVAQQSELIPEAGQSVATAQQKAIVRMASQIVSQMQIWW